MTVTYHVGDSRALTAQIPDGSIDLVASSPPFLALRSYLPADHASKADEIGSEANPAAFIDTLLELTAEWGRVLAPHGSIAIELGDTYSGSGGGGGDYLPGGLRENQPGFGGSADRQREGNAAHWRAKNQTPDAWPRAKSLALIPQAYAVALAYGINPLTGQPSPAGRWLVRNVIVWHRPNPAVGALGDKYRPSTSYIVVATRSAKRWFDLTAVRTAHKDPDDATRARAGVGRTPDPGGNANSNGGNPAGAPPLDTWTDEYGSHDTWTLTTQPSGLAHYAMWPAKLAERLILSMCPAEVCRICHEPRRRIEDRLNPLRCDSQKMGRNALIDGYGIGRSPSGVSHDPQRVTLGWSDCGHDHFRPGHVLDPFGGTGTTGAVADLHGRDATLIDIDQRNHDIYPRRYDEVKRALFDTPIPDPAQMELAL